MAAIGSGFEYVFIQKKYYKHQSGTKSHEILRKTGCPVEQTVRRICEIGMAVDSMLWHLEYVNSRKWSRSRSSVEVASHKLDQLIYWVVS